METTGNASLWGVIEPETLALIDSFLMVCKKTSQGREICKFMLDFWKTFSSIEDQYHKSIVKLCTAVETKIQKGPSILQFLSNEIAPSIPVEEIRSINAAWSITKLEVERVGRHHSLISSSVQEKVISALTSFMEKEPESKKLVQDASNASTELKKIQQRIFQLKDKYEKALKDEEKIQKQFDRAKSDGSASAISRLQVQLTNSKNQVQMLFSKLEESERQLKDFSQQIIQIKFPTILYDLKLLERSRLESIKTSLESFAGIIHSSVPALKELSLKVSDATEEINPDKDVEDFFKNQTAIQPKSLEDIENEKQGKKPRAEEKRNSNDEEETEESTPPDKQTKQTPSISEQTEEEKEESEEKDLIQQKLEQQRQEEEIRREQQERLRSEQLEREKLEKKKHEREKIFQQVQEKERLQQLENQRQKEQWEKEKREQQRMFEEEEKKRKEEEQRRIQLEKQRQMQQEKEAQEKAEKEKLYRERLGLPNPARAPFPQRNVSRMPQNNSMNVLENSLPPVQRIVQSPMALRQTPPTNFNANPDSREEVLNQFQDPAQLQRKTAPQRGRGLPNPIRAERIPFNNESLGARRALPLPSINQENPSNQLPGQPIAFRRNSNNFSLRPSVPPVTRMNAAPIALLNPNVSPLPQVKENRTPSPPVQAKEESSEEEEEIISERKEPEKNPTEYLKQIFVLVKENDYFQLFDFELTQQITIEDINRKRRELTRQLHPDHFMNDPQKKEEANKKLTKINEVYTNVFKQETTFIIYQKLCQYRNEYNGLLEKDEKLLQFAANNLLKMKLAMKKTNMPVALIREIDLILEMLKDVKNIDAFE